MEREMIAVEDIVSVREIADMLGVNVSTVKRWIERRPKIDFPVQVKKLANVDLYNKTEVSVWFIKYRAKWGAYYGV
jgi:transposase